MITQRLEALGLSFPEVSDARKEELGRMKKILESEKKK